ncbi:MAG: methylated-DNA--[protein]-cysteine S-methyltransferase [Muribaculaceae bacterium]|nr:methylated-DNA--[protein]-cysteine S-methyltransferase [Muribaculaceae bacterium]
MNTSKDNILEHLSHPAFRLIGEVADEMNRECYVVGGYVRDIFLGRRSKDIDFVTVGSGIEVAKRVAQKFGPNKSHLSVFKTYGTAQVKAMGMELEFVGARRESYNRNSRNPIVEDGSLNDDQCRRDFTINAMAISVNHDRWGELLDPFDGIGDMERRLIRTPLNPDITFSDDPLRMMRAVRFATQLGFEIEEGTFAAIKRNAERIKIITRERIADELMKIMRSPVPSRGFFLLDKSGLLPLICPELAQLKGVDTVNGRGHKDNFLHTMQVLDNVAAESDNEWLRWAALFHDIGKPATKHWDEKQGWTFHNHNFIGEKMVPRIFAKMRLPLNENMKYVKKLVGLHMRPIALVEEEVTDSAVRRMLFEAGDDIDDLMTLCRADITSKNQEKVKRFRENYELVKQKIIDIEEKDRVRNFQPPVDGKEIMDTFGLEPSRPVGEIKEAIKDAILDGVISNDYAQAHNFMMQKAEELGIKPVNAGKLNCVAIDSPMGKISIAATATGIAAIEFGESDFSELAAKMRMELCNTATPLLENCIKQLKEYFNGNRQEFSLPLHLIGTDFQMKVWRVLRDIPYGTTISYKEEANKVGDEKAVRAVAQANGANPVPIIIPCHRVIYSDGTLGGYSSGVDKKLFLLNMEASNM